MQSQKAIEPRDIYKFLFWGLLVILVVGYVLDAWSARLGDADKLVLRQQIHGGAWIYVTHYGAPATDPDTLRFYLSEQIAGNDPEILERLNKTGAFMITDSALQDVVIRDSPGGAVVDVNGAVYRYYSKQYIGSGNFNSYRISLNQRDER